MSSQEGAAESRSRVLSETGDMKLLAWNLNHRAARRRIPSWIATAINEQAPDVLVLTEYVEGPDHDSFLATLKMDFAHPPVRNSLAVRIRCSLPRAMHSVGMSW
jgi:hypothetical protein